MIPGVSEWIYTADKNLKLFRAVDRGRLNLTKLPNAMPLDDRPFPKSRSEMGIAESTVVFTLVARGIKQKGWRAAVETFRRLRRERPDLDAHLILVGTGDQADNVVNSITTDNITFLGFQSCINGLYRISDCALIPTRFDGESYPLCIIQALQEKLPVIATDIGEISSMVIDGDCSAGILIENLRNSEEFFEKLYLALIEMMDESARQQYSANAAKLCKKFDLDLLVDEYAAIYERAISGFAQTRDIAEIS